MITLAIAKTIIAGAQADAAKNNFKPLSVVVLDKGAHVIAFEKQDGSSNKIRRTLASTIRFSMNQ